MKPRKLIPYLVLPTLFISALGFQTHLNLKPQIIIALFTSLTIGSYLFKKEKIVIFRVDVHAGGQDKSSVYTC